MNDSSRAWEIVKQLNSEINALGSNAARKLLAEGLKLSAERPSKLHSALLGSAVKVAEHCPDFRFIAFLSMWHLGNLRPEDHERTKSQDGKSFPSLADRVCKAFAHDRLLHPEDALPEDQFAILQPMLDERGLIPMQHMVVTRIKEASNQQGRKFRFVTLVSPSGRQVECVANQLQTNPLCPLPEGKRHYVNIGQLYDCILKTKSPAPEGSPEGQSTSSSTLSLKQAYLSSKKAEDCFPTAVGYVEHIDTEHGHIHVYDAQSRHFVAPVLRFSKEQEGDMVRFVPVTPSDSMFKTAVCLTRATIDEAYAEGLIREIKITSVNESKRFASWELADASRPLTEQLSPYQIAQGLDSPSFTTGYLNLTDELSLASSLTLKAIVYLKRGKDKQKRPHIAKIIKCRR